MDSFAQVLARARPTETGRTLDVPETWQQGRTAYGGFSSALALSEAMRIGGELPPLRSAQVAMIGPLAGEVHVSADVQRRGRNATWVSATIASEQGVGLTASFVFMGPVASASALSACPTPRGLICVEQAQDFVNARAPAFVRNHLEVRFALPRAEARQADVCWWVRLRDADGLDPMVALLLTADGLPPAVMPLLSAGVPVSTMHWQVGLLTAAPRTVDGWWLLRSTTDHARDGSSSQNMTLWNSAGEPMLAGMQSVALFG